MYLFIKKEHYVAAVFIIINGRVEKSNRKYIVVHK